MANKWYKSEIHEKATEIAEITPTITGTPANVKYAIETNFVYDSDENIISSTLYFWSTSWQISDGTFANMSTIADINANVSTFPLSQPYGKFRVVANSSDTSTVDEWAVKHEKFERSTRLGCKVKFRITDGSGNGKPNVAIVYQLADVTSGERVTWDGLEIDTSANTKYTDSDGYCAIWLMPNDDDDILPANTHWQITVGSNAAQKYTIPKDTAEIWITELTPI